MVARADWLIPISPAGYGLVFVREASGLKDAYLAEAAFALYCAEVYQQPPARIFVYYLHKSYMREAELDLNKLFVQADVTRRARIYLDSHREAFAAFAAALVADPCLDTAADTPCEQPEVCPICGEGRDALAPEHVLTLHRGGRFARELYARGVTSILEIEPGELAHDRQRIQQCALRTGQPHVDYDALRAFLDTFEGPVRYLDFEAINQPVPSYTGTKPWEHIPFLYSIHTEAHGDKTDTDRSLAHSTYLCRADRDDRHGLATRLLADLGERGSIIVYSAAFERAVMVRLGQWFPEHAAAFEHAASRVVDLLAPFDQFAYYNAEQRGKVSLKNVLPALTDASYAKLAVQDGLTANQAFRYLQKNPSLDDEERVAIERELIEYCAMDTMAMVLIVRRLREIVR